jgi:WD40 repeat protein
MFMRQTGEGAGAPPHRLLSASGGSLFLWDVPTARLVQTVGSPPAPAAGDIPQRWQEGLLFGVAAQPDGPLVAAACSDGNLRLWAADGGGAALGPLCTLPWNDAMGSDCSFGQQGELAAVSQDGAVVVLDVRQAGSCLQHVSLGVPLLTCQLLQGAGGRCVMAAGGDGSVYFVDVASGDVASIHPPLLPGRPLLAAALAPGGGRLAVGGESIALGEDEAERTRQVGGLGAQQARAQPARWAPLHVWERQEAAAGELEAG